MGDLQVKIGEVLRLERERQGFKLEDISTDLKIPINNLQAVENGDVDALPSELYFGLFAKSYSEAIGVDYTATVDAIKEELASVPTPPPENSKKKKSVTVSSEIDDAEEAVNNFDESTTSVSFFVKQKKLIYSVAVAVIVIGGYFVLSQLLKDISSGSEEYTSNMIEAEDIHNTPTESPYEKYDWNVPAYKKPEPFTLTMTARAESWSTVLADGDTAIFRRLVPGRTYKATARYRMFLSVAVPSKVDIKLNGQPIDPVSPETKRISRVLIDQTNIDSFLTGPEITADINTPVQSAEKTHSLPVSIADQEIDNPDASEVQNDER